LIQDRFEEQKLSGNLPSHSCVGLAILRLTQDEKAPVEALVRCVQADPALSGRILKRANQDRAIGEAPSTTLVQAAQRLGFRELRRIALGFTLVTSDRSGFCANFEYERFWSGSLACAIAARALAERLGMCDAEEAFTCGLLARIGALALATVHTEAYGHLLAELPPRADAELCRGERRAFGIDHWEVSASLLGDWGLADVYSGAVLAVVQRTGEEAPSAPHAGALGGLTGFAMQIAELLACDRTSAPADFERCWSAVNVLARQHGLDPTEIGELCARVALQWRDWSELVGMPVAARHGFDAAVGTVIDFPELPELTEEPAGTGASRISLEPRAERAPVHILLVDDDDRLARLVAHHLTRAGYHVRTATNGLEALRIATNEAPHIVVTDWMMPEMDGLQLCRALRKTESGRKTYVLMLTAKEDEDRIVDAFHAGADDFVTKPFNPRILLARVGAGQRIVELQLRIDADKRVREQQVAEMGLLTRKLRAAALTDVLTELPNRRYAMNRLEHEWDAAVRLDRPLSVSMIDIDEFKRINDLHGHDVGDSVLKATAATLRSYTRRGDVICRLGGEEFIVIHVNCDGPSALVCAERLRTQVEASRVESGGFRGNVTISIGIAERSATFLDADVLLKAADQAVYAAKAAGRNCCKLSGPGDWLVRSARAQ
jgi:diguanylate cyclase (GGDEF)-like protein